MKIKFLLTILLNFRTWRRQVVAIKVLNVVINNQDDQETVTKIIQELSNEISVLSLLRHRNSLF